MRAMKSKLTAVLSAIKQEEAMIPGEACRIFKNMIGGGFPFPNQKFLCGN